MTIFAKDKLIAYGQLMRLDKPIGTLLLLWPTLWALYLAEKAMPTLSVLAIFICGVFLMRSAGCVINDYAIAILTEKLNELHYAHFQQVEQHLVKQNGYLSSSFFVLFY